MEILKQGQYQPIPVEEQIVAVFAGTKGHLDRLAVSSILAFEPNLYRYARENGADVLETILTTGELSEETEEKLAALIEAAVDLFLKEHPEASVA